MHSPVMACRRAHRCSRSLRSSQKTLKAIRTAQWITQEYTGNAEASDALWARGYMNTGDIGIIEPDGYLRVIDHIKDVIKTGGEWVSSIQLEDLISQCAGVSEAAVFGVPDDKWGERPIAVVTTSAAITEVSLRAHLQAF